MSKSVFVNSEITPDHVWINISKGKTVRAAVLTGCCKIYRGVYKLEDEMVSTVKEMIRCAEEGENIRFYVLDTVDVDTEGD